MVEDRNSSYDPVPGLWSTFGYSYLEVFWDLEPHSIESIGETQRRMLVRFTAATDDATELQRERMRAVLRSTPEESRLAWLMNQVTNSDESR